jgi:hypothetical protein
MAEMAASISARRRSVSIPSFGIEISLAAF